MNRVKEIFENMIIDSWAQHFLRSLHQFNKQGFRAFGKKWGLEYRG